MTSRPGPSAQFLSVPESHTLSNFPSTVYCSPCIGGLFRINKQYIPTSFTDETLNLHKEMPDPQKEANLPSNKNEATQVIPVQSGAGQAASASGQMEQAGGSHPSAAADPVNQNSEGQDDQDGQGSPMEEEEEEVDFEFPIQVSRLHYDDVAKKLKRRGEELAKEDTVKKLKQSGNKKITGKKEKQPRKHKFHLI